MNRKAKVLNLLREELKIVEKAIIEFPPYGKDELFNQLVEEAKGMAETIIILENETP